MPSDILEEYRKTSRNLAKTSSNLRNLKYGDGTRIYSDECISQIEEIECSPFYCSANEKQLLTKHDQGDCNSIISRCIDEIIKKVADGPVKSVIEKLKSVLQSICNNYPKTSAQLQPEPPTVTSSGNCHFGQPILLAVMIYFFIKIYV
ncbi:Hypothetical predicted protein [Paramuricea clavata]|uniref:Uncharacterized protein n=1 Tax=Paramuricea clavata TaxID=317549 RepID=A0A7D9JVX5_PARCT|nr:Hypothetical predicted protein [Paramuricea clavata]